MGFPPFPLGNCFIVFRHHCWTTCPEIQHEFPVAQRGISNWTYFTGISVLKCCHLLSQKVRFSQQIGLLCVFRVTASCFRDKNEFSLLFTPVCPQIQGRSGWIDSGSHIIDRVVNEVPVSGPNSSLPYIYTNPTEHSGPDPLVQLSCLQHKLKESRGR